MTHSFDDIYTEYYPKVSHYVRVRVPDTQEVEDITSDVFVKVMQAYEQYDSEKAMLSTWIYTIAANTVRDHYRRISVKARHSFEMEEETLEALAYEEDSCMDGLFREETMNLLADALMTLTERERIIVIMHYYKNIPHKEIADRLELSHANIRFINHRALEKIRDYFQKQEYL